ncbi:MAG TPA: hypothetical protein VF137_06000 [Candidatus Dormibacteraeota bacterium]
MAATEPTGMRAYVRPLALALIVLAVTSIPLVYAVTTEPHDRVFMGFFVNGADMNSYLEKMREGSDGLWYWINRYSTETSPPVYLFIWLLAWGHLAALLHLGALAAFQLFRVSGAIALFLAAWAFIRHFCRPDAQRFALYLLAFTMGFGILIWAVGSPVVLGHHTDALDLRMPELSAFFSILTGPTWPAAFVVAGAVLTLRAVESGDLRLAAPAAFAWLGEASMHPQMLVVLFVVLGVALAWRGPGARGWAAAAVAIGPALPYLGYATWVSSRSAEVLRWQAQGVDGYAPDALSLAVALLPAVVPAALAIPGRLRRRSREDVFLLAWLLAVMAVMWVPNPASSIGRRFLDGIYVPLACLAADGLYGVVISRLHSARSRRLVPFSYLAVSAITPAFAVLALVGTAHASQYALTRSEYDSLLWLQRQPAGLVLSSARIGLYVPAYTDDTVYVGHYSETFQYGQKSTQASDLLAGRADIAAFVRARGVRYVLWTAADSEAPPAELGAPAFSEPGSAVFVTEPTRT